MRLASTKPHPRRERCVGGHEPPPERTKAGLAGVVIQSLHERDDERLRCLLLPRVRRGAVHRGVRAWPDRCEAGPLMWWLYRFLAAIAISTSAVAGVFMLNPAPVHTPQIPIVQDWGHMPGATNPNDKLGD